MMRLMIPVFMLFACLTGTALLSGCSDSKINQDEPDMIEETRRQIRALQDAPVPEGNVRITINRLEYESTNRTALSTLIAYRDNTIHLRGGGLNRKNGVFLFGTTRTLSAKIPAGEFDNTFAKRSKQFLTVLPGTTASMECFQTRTTGWLVVIPVWRGEVIIDTLEERITGAGLQVHVHSVRDGRIDLELMPYLHATDRRGPVEIDELNTRVIIENGMPLVIAGNDTQTQSAGKALFSYREKQTHRSVVLVLVAETSE